MDRFRDDFGRFYGGFGRPNGPRSIHRGPQRATEGRREPQRFTRAIGKNREPQRATESHREPKKLFEKKRRFPFLVESGLCWRGFSSQDAPKTPPRRAKTPPRRLKMRPRHPKTPPSGFKSGQDVPKRLPRAPKTPMRAIFGQFLVEFGLIFRRFFD